MYYIHIVTTRKRIHNLILPVLYSRQALLTLACGVRLIVFSLFFYFINTFVGHILLKLRHYFRSLLFFLARTFFTYGRPSWVGIKIAVQRLKINSNPGKKCLLKSLFKRMQTTNLKRTQLKTNTYQDF